jgi:SAM-dependent methyltransferase
MSTPRIRPRSFENRYSTRTSRETPWSSPRPSSQVVRAIAEHRFKQGSRLIDVGCGSGTNAIFLAKNGFRVSAVDVSKSAVEVARRRVERAGVSVDLRVADALDLPFLTRAFDGGVDMGCFHTIPPRKRAEYGREVGRVLKPGACYLLSWSAPESPVRHDALPWLTWPTLSAVASAFEPTFMITSLCLNTDAGRQPTKNRFAIYDGVLVRR